jgi:hypothetical protein
MSVAQSPDPRNIVGHVPGRICVSPTNLALPYPHGGTDIGELGPTRFSVNRSRTIVRDEVTGFDTIGVVGHGESCAMFSVIRDHNAKGYELFVGGSAGSTSKTPGFDSMAAGHAGRIYEDEALPFLFSPYDTENDLAVMMYRGVPLPLETTDLNLMLGTEGDVWQLAVVIELIRRETDERIWSARRLEDLVL